MQTIPCVLYRTVANACYRAFSIGFPATELGGFLTDCSFDSNRRSISPIKAIRFVGSFSCAANSHSSIQLSLLSQTINVPSGLRTTPQESLLNCPRVVFLGL